MKVLFNVAHLYYLPQYLPVWNELKKRGVSCLFVFHKDTEMMSILSAVIKKEVLPSKWVATDLEAVNLYQTEKADWIIFGDSTSQLGRLPDNVRTALLYHGIGVKSCYYDADLMRMNVRFVEGEYRLRELRRRYPSATLVSAGFAKLDPLLSADHGKMSPFDLVAAGLNPNRPTLLYAPTFYPSSIERMPSDWPEQFGNYNLIVKPHFFTFCKARYRYQRKKLESWSGYNNTYIARPEEYSLLPFMASSDLLISEASSAFFEFAALDKPIVWCDFLKLRWNYRGPFRYRFHIRMDQGMEKFHNIGPHVEKYQDLKGVVDQQIRDPGQYHQQRKQSTKWLLGSMDGHASRRIVDYLLFGLEIVCRA